VAFLLFRPVAVTVGEVARRDIAPAIQGVGTVEAKVVVKVGSKITGRLVSVLVDQGDTVKAGQVMARLDDAQFRAEVSRSEASVRAAEAQLADLLAGTRPEEIAEARANVTRAQAQLDDLLAGSRQPEIEELRERLKSAGATRTLAEREFQRAHELFGKELIAAQEVDRARQAYEVAVAQERGARQILQLALEGARPQQIDAARAQLDAAQRRLELLLAGARPQQVEAARAQVREAQAALALALERLADTVIVSPFDSYVVSRDLESGATVNPGTPILKIADPHTAWVTVYVDERDTAGLAIGNPAEIAFRSLPGRTLLGRVARIQRESDRVTEQLAVDVALEERPPRVTLGEQVEATVRPPARRGVVALPLSALVRRPQGSGALVVVDGRLRFHQARLGLADPAGWIQVLEGLGAGEQVVLAPGRLADPANEGRRVLARRGNERAEKASARP
jgi:RND family efflux transporter MFP subunit